MEQINVLVLITVMDRAGAETMMMNYLRNINREKIHIDFLINRAEKADYEEEIEKLGSRVYHMCPLYPGKFRRYKKEFRQFLENHPEYKIIHSHLEERSYFALKIAKQMKVPIRIVHAHSMPKHFDIKMPVRYYFRKKVQKYCTHRFACGEEAAKWLFGTNACIELKDAVESGNLSAYPILMKNAVDTTEFYADETKRKKIRKQLKIKDKELVIGHIGRFTYEKNHPFLVDIFNIVNQYMPDSRLLLIGGGKPQKEVETKANIKKKVKQLGINSKVKFLGVRDDINDLMNGMDILVMPSISEGFPVTLMEAQSAGLRCLVSDRVSYQCNVTEEMQYMSLEQGEEEWANKILSFCTLQLNAEEMNEKVKVAGFDIKQNAEWLEKFYEKGLGCR